MEGYLKLEHVSRMRWRAPYTGAHGTVPQADSAARDAIIGNLFETYPPAEPTSGPFLRLLKHQAECGNYT